MSNETKATESNSPAKPSGPRPLRVWPGVFLVVLMIGARFVPEYLEGGLSRYWMIAMMGPMLCCLLLVIWWLAVSRAYWKERVFGFLGLIAVFALTMVLVEPLMRGPGTIYITLPMGMTAFVIGAVWFKTRRPLVRTGRAVLLAAIGFGFSILLRNDGMDGNYQLTLHWRWSQTPEEQLLKAKTTSSPATAPNASSVETNLAFANPEWPGFRGANRSSNTPGLMIATNWSEQPPKQLWKVSVGPGWSSFAVAGNRLFTQEQRGAMEAVVCYDAGSGREIWNRQYEARLEDPMGGPGPRATPTLANGGLFVLGATGMFLRLNPATGDIAWQKNLKEVASRAAALMWGYSGSPLVVGSNVMVWAGGADGKGLLALDVETGALQWSVAAGTDTYASPQLSTIAGEELVLMLSNDGLVLVEPASGKVRLNYEWKFQGYRALQPAVVGGDTVLIGTPMNVGTRAIRITKANGELAAEELWTSRNLKTDFSDMVTHQGYIYGNDNGFLACLDLKTGDRMWKGGRYGKGQFLLLENAGLLLVVAEDGQLHLVRGDPKEFVEVASFKALEGKTWNHPVVVGDKLYVRNSQEAAAFQLSTATTAAAP
ncbi:MAG TPA: PQQ-binding-like beta-propeller repeat protein [Verrucomicrobiae bacterium]|nr:PQQ-binding-like beta-propeller repeat protein [Verrucomicrobiae bacterium]